MVEEQHEQKVAGQKVAAKNMVIHQSREELGLHPASQQAHRLHEGQYLVLQLETAGESSSNLLQFL